MCFAKFDHLNQCNALWSITFIKYIFLQIAQKKSQRLTASEIFHQPLVSETFIKHENDPNLMKIKSPYSNTFGMYCLLPFPSMTVNFDEKHLTFWILGNAFYGTPGTVIIEQAKKRVSFHSSITFKADTIRIKRI